MINLNNFLNERTNWTKEMLQKEADKYKTRGEFKKKSVGAYIKSRRLGLLDELFKNHSNLGHDENRKPKNYWTEEKLQEEVNKYKTRGEFWENNSGAASIALSKGLMDKLFNKHPNLGNTNKQVLSGYWTKEMLQSEADKYKTRIEFKNKNKAAYSAARHRDFFDDLFKNHPNEGYSDKEEWKENSYVIYVYEIEEFNSAYVGLTNNVIRRDREHLFDEKEKMSLFCKENDIPYPKYKILEEDLKSTEAKKQEKYWVDFYKDNEWIMFNIAKPGALGSSIVKWTKKALQKEVDKYKTRGEFGQSNGSAYGAALRKGIMDELFKKHPNLGRTDSQEISGYWTEEKLQEEANKYKTRGEFQSKNASAYQAARKKKIVGKIFNKHPNKGYIENRKETGYWTREKLQEEADKYKTLNDFSDNSKAAYSAARRSGILKELFHNHPNKGLTTTWTKKWSKEKLQEEADKYKTRGEFWSGNSSAANRALAKGLMDELFKNHPNEGFARKYKNIKSFENFKN